MLAAGSQMPGGCWIRVYRTTARCEGTKAAECIAVQMVDTSHISQGGRQHLSSTSAHWQQMSNNYRSMLGREDGSTAVTMYLVWRVKELKRKHIQSWQSQGFELQHSSS
eukprot:GHUV01037514.1.p2 GENE.GHUV01037514.1~~GHUV01037514.1.p2  ORF type:complete len:109 (-),score=19.73 GHUV01037514.1:147-473(-)